MPKEMQANRNERVKKLGNLINRFYRNTAPLLLGEALVFGFVGILMMVKPVEFLSMLAFIVGGVLIVFGLFRVSMVFVSNLGWGVGSFDVFFGLVTMMLGIVFCVYPRGAAIGIIYIFIVMFLLNACRMLFFAINMARAGFEYYRVDLIAAIVMVCLSIILLFLPGLAIGILLWITAIYLLVYAVADVYMFWKLLRLRRMTQK